MAKKSDDQQNSGNRKLSTESQKQMAEFQQVVEGFASHRSSSRRSSAVTSCSSPPTSPGSSASIVRSEADGYLHSEVGIDEELERLLADDPGLFMEDGPGPHKMVWGTSPPKTPVVEAILPPSASISDDIVHLQIPTRYKNLKYCFKMRSEKKSAIIKLIETVYAN